MANEAEMECFGTGRDYRNKHVTKVVGIQKAMDRIKARGIKPPAA